MNSKQFLKEGFLEDAHEAHVDHEVQMARVDCYYAAEHAIVLHKLLRNISEEQGLEGWVASKITLANDYLKSVREHLEYQMINADADEGDFLPLAEGISPTKKKVSEDITDGDNSIQEFERGPWYVILRGQPVTENGEPKRFNWLNGAKTYFRSMLDDQPELAREIKSEYDKADDKKTVIYYTKKLPTTSSSNTQPETDQRVTEAGNKPGLWANIRAKRERIKSGSGERMRKPGSKGAPSNADLKSIRAASNESTELEESLDDEFGEFAKKFGQQRGITIKPRDPKPRSPFPEPENKRIENPLDRESLEARLKELQSLFDPAYEYSDDHAFWSEQNEIAKEIRSIKRALSQQGVAEDNEQKYRVTYDMYFTNREKPLYTKTRTVRADSEEEAIKIIQDLIGGRNHRIEKDVAEGGILKSIKRGLQGWGTGNAPTPQELVRRNKGYSDDAIKALARDTRNINPHTPGGLQKRVVDREMKKRGLGEQGVAEGYKEPTDAAGHAKMAAKIKKMLDDTLADRGDRHGNPDPERLTRAYEYHMEKAEEKSQGVAEGFSDVVKGIKRSIKGKEHPDVVASKHAGRAIGHYNQGDIAAGDKETERYKKIRNMHLKAKGVVEGLDKKLEFDSFADAKQYFSDLAHERGTSPVEMYGKGDAERYRQYVLKHVKKNEQDVAEGAGEQKYMAVYNKHIGNPSYIGKPITSGGKVIYVTASSKEEASSKFVEIFNRSQVLSSFIGKFVVVPKDAGGEQGVAEGWKEKVGAAALAGSMTLGSPAQANSIAQGLSRGITSAAGSSVVDKNRNAEDEEFAKQIPDEKDREIYLKALKQIKHSRALAYSSPAMAGANLARERNFKKLKQQIAEKYNIPMSVKEQGVAEGFPYDVDHMPGPRKSLADVNKTSKYVVATNAIGDAKEHRVTVNATSKNNAMNLALDHFEKKGLKPRIDFDGLRLISGVAEGKFTINRNTGAKLHPRTGVELPPKEKPMTMKDMFRQPKLKAPKLTLDAVWRKVEDVVSRIYPDGDPIDYLAPWLERHGIRGFETGEILDRAAKKNGYKDLYDYYNSMKDLYGPEQGVAEDSGNAVEALIQVYNNRDQKIIKTKVFASEAEANRWADRNNAVILKLKDVAKKSALDETSSGSVATVVNPTPKNRAKVGTLFGGTYKQTNARSKK